MPQLKKLLEPGFIGKVRLKNRISIGPMERVIANKDGSVTQRYIDYLVERAKNGAGMIAVEATYIDPLGRGHIYQLGLHDDKLIPGHKRLTEALHRYGVKVVTELQHAGRQTSSAIIGRQPVAPSPVPCLVSGGDMPQELTVDEIKEIVGKFAEAARRAKETGYDMITLHGAHGYLICAFASPYANKRTDEYGGSLENRMRFSLEVFEAVREEVGHDYPVGFRISADEFVDGGFTLDETTVMAKQLEEAGIDFLDVSCGNYDARGITVGYMDVPIGYMVYLAAAMKEVVKIPVICTGRINDMVFAEGVLENNQADFVHMVRAFHADPEILVKSEQGRMDEVCMCIACNKCIDMMRQNQPTICTVNPAALREREFELKPAKDKKRVMVIGGGVAGMEAARIARLRGHEVTLFDKDEELGGQVRWASKPRYHQELSQVARYRIQEVKRTGVKLELGREVALAEVERFNPDVVVVATGAVPLVLKVPGVEKALVATSVDILSGRRQIGKKGVVIGGQKEGLAVAEFLAENGSEVIIVEASDTLGADLGVPARVRVGDRIAEDPMIEVRLKTTVEWIEDDVVMLQSGGKLEEVEGIDSVVLAWDRISVNQLADEIIVRGKVREVYSIGDAVMPREIADAIYEGAVTGRRI